MINKKNKKGIATIVLVFFLMICGIGVGLGAYLVSQQIKTSLSTSQSAGPVGELAPPADLQPSVEPEAQTVSSPAEVNQPMSVSPEPLSLEINFSQSGTILDWDSQTERHTGIWRFLWDEPGALALNVELEFNQQSQCDWGQGNKVCQLESSKNGTTVQLEGNRVDNKVIVINLKAI